MEPPPSAFAVLDADQLREETNTRQRFLAWRAAELRQRETRGSMVFKRTKGRDYLLRSGYDKAGRRHQISLGPRSPETELIKAEFDRGRAAARERLAGLDAAMRRQASLNRVLGLGRVPLLGARILRAIDRAGLLGHGLRIVGTYALFAYEAAAGVRFDPGLTATDDVDLLIDARASLFMVASEDLDAPSLLELLQRVDGSFERLGQGFRAANRDGFLVDLVGPMRDPPWAHGEVRVGAEAGDLAAVEIEGLAWHESAPAFEAVGIDLRGEPLRIVTSDPRVFAAHKLWLSHRPDRAPPQRRRDRLQAEAVGALVATHLPHLPFSAGELRMLPRDVVRRAAPLFRSLEG